MVSLAAGCSSSGSSGGGDTAPQFDGDLGFENVDPGYGVDAPDGDQTPDLGFDFGYVYIPDLGEEVPVPTHPIMGTPSNPIEIDINNPDSKMAAVKERSDENETLYSVYIGEVRVGESSSTTTVSQSRRYTATKPLLQLRTPKKTLGKFAALTAM